MYNVRRTIHAGKERQGHERQRCVGQSGQQCACTIYVLYCMPSTVVRSYMTMNIRVRTCRRVAHVLIWPTRVKNFSYAPIVLLHERVYIRTWGHPVLITSPGQCWSPLMSCVVVCLLFRCPRTMPCRCTRSLLAWALAWHVVARS